MALYAVCAGILLLSPFVYYPFDVAECWLRWSRASGGLHPAAIYRLTPDCNYPPLVLYLLTAAERLRLWLHAAPAGPAAVTLIKLPNLLACVAGVPLCFYGLRRWAGEEYARGAAMAYGLCLALWVNAGLWGQYDALQSLEMAAVIVAALNNRAGWCGAALGLALATKFQAVMIVPAVFAYFLARRAWADAAVCLGAAVLVWGAVAAPFYLAGQGQGVTNAYVGSVGHWPRLQMGALNIWYVASHTLGHLLFGKHAPPPPDSARLLHLISYKDVGLILVAGYLLFLLTTLWRNRTPQQFILVCAMSVFAFFMLATEMHERYIVPAVAILALIAPSPGNRMTRFLFAALSVSAVLNELFMLQLNPNPVGSVIVHVFRWLGHNAALGEVVAIFNIGLFCWATPRIAKLAPGSQQSAGAYSSAV